MKMMNIPVFRADFPASYCTSGQFICEEGGAIHPARTLDSYVLLFGNSGDYPIAVDGREYHLTPDSFLILPADHPHCGTAPCTPGLRHYWCHFYLVNPQLTMGEDRILPENPQESLVLPIYGTASSPDRVRLLFHQLIDRSRSGSIYREAICNHLLEMLLMEISDDYVRGTTDLGVGGKAEYITEQVLEWVRLNGKSVDRVSEVANHFGYNCEYLTTLIKKITGKTLIDHIIDEKIAEGKRLLLCSDKPIKEIAILAGFHGDKYFLRVFKKKVGVSPGDFRNAYCKMHYNTN